MTRDQAIQQGYAAQVAAVDQVSMVIADYSQRVCSDSTVIEFSASHTFMAGTDGNEDEYTITAYYYQDAEDIDALEDGDLGSLDWVATNYEVQL